MICTFVHHRVLRKLEKRKSISRADVGEQDGEYTYLKDIRDHKLVFVCTVCRKVSENKSTKESSERKSGNASQAYRAAHHRTRVVGTAPFAWLHTRWARFPAWLFALSMT